MIKVSLRGSSLIMKWNAELETWIPRGYETEESHRAAGGVVWSGLFTLAWLGLHPWSFLAWVTLLVFLILMVLVLASWLLDARQNRPPIGSFIPITVTILSFVYFPMLLALVGFLVILLNSGSFLMAIVTFPISFVLIFLLTFQFTNPFTGKPHSPERRRRLPGSSPPGPEFELAVLEGGLTNLDWKLDSARALLVSQPDSPRAISILLSLLRDGYAPRRAEAAEILGDRATPTKPIVAAVRGACRDPENWVRREAVLALGHLANRSGSILRFDPLLFEDPSLMVRWAAVDAVGEARFVDAETMAGVRAALSDPAEGIRVAAARALESGRQRQSEGD